MQWPLLLFLFVVLELRCPVCGIEMPCPTGVALLYISDSVHPTETYFRWTNCTDYAAALWVGSARDNITIHLDASVVYAVFLGAVSDTPLIGVSIVMTNCVFNISTATFPPALYTGSRLSLITAVSRQLTGLSIQMDRCDIVSSNIGAMVMTQPATLAVWSSFSLQITNTNITTLVPTEAMMAISGTVLTGVSVLILNSTLVQTMFTDLYECTVLLFRVFPSSDNSLQRLNVTIVASSMTYKMNMRKVLFAMRTGKGVWFHSTTRLLNYTGPKYLMDSLLSARDSRFECEGTSCLMLHIEGAAPLNTNITLNNIYANMTAAGQPVTITNGRTSSLVDMQDIDSLISRLHMALTNTKVLFLVQLGYPDATMAGSLQNGNSFLLASDASVMSSVRIVNATMEMIAVDPYTSAFPQLLSKVLLCLFFQRGAAQDLVFELVNSTLSFDVPYYCYGQRNAVNESMLGTLMYIATNAGSFTLYVSGVILTGGDMSRIRGTSSGTSILAVSYPFRQQCPQAKEDRVRTTTNFPFGAAEINRVPLFTIVSVAIFAVSGIDPYARFVTDVLPSALQPLVTAKIGQWQLSMRDSHFVVTDPRVSVVRDGPPLIITVPQTPAPTSLIPYETAPLETYLRAGVILAVGLVAASDMTINAQLSAEPTSVQNVSMLMIDTVTVTDKLQLMIAGPLDPLTGKTETLVVSRPYLVANRSVLSNVFISFRNISAVLQIGAGKQVPPALYFYKVNFTELTKVGVYYSNFSSFNRMAGGEELRFFGHSGFELNVGCIAWNEKDLPRSKIGSAIPNAYVTVIPGCPPLVLSPTRTASASYAPRYAKEQLRLSQVATVVAGAAIAFGGAVSPAAVMSMQRSIAIMLLSTCGGEDAMSQTLDIFNSPTQILISAGTGRSDDAVGDAEFGAAFRGAVVGNVCVFWIGGALLSFVAVQLLRLRRGVLWNFSENAALLRLPGALLPVLWAPLLQPVLSSSLVLLLHGRGLIDYAIAAFGAVTSLAVLVFTAVVVSPWVFRARTQRVTCTASLLRRLLQEQRLTQKQSAVVSAKILYLKCCMFLFTADDVWLSVKRKDNFVEWFGAVFESMKRARHWAILLELVVVVEASITSSLMPTGKENCQMVAIVDAVANGLLLVAYAALRPYGARYDAGVAAVTVAWTSMLACMVAAGASEDVVQGWTSAMNYFTFLLLAIGLLQPLLSALCGLPHRWLELVYALSMRVQQLDPAALLAQVASMKLGGPNMGIISSSKTGEHSRRHKTGRPNDSLSDGTDGDLQSDVVPERGTNTRRTKWRPSEQQMSELEVLIRMITDKT